MKMRLSSALTVRPGDEDRLDLVFHALSDRTRRALLIRLAQGPAMVTELASPFAISLNSVSKHIRVLEESGLVTRQVDGRIHRCTVAVEPLRDVGTWLEHYRSFWEDALSELARHVERRPARRARPTAIRGGGDR